MTGPVVRVRIERLVLEGVDPAAGQYLAAGIQARLGRLTAGGLPTGASAGHTDRISLELAGSPTAGLSERLASTLATMVYRRLSHGP
jgi:hypothetical protein